MKREIYVAEKILFKLVIEDSEFSDIMPAPINFEDQEFRADIKEKIKDRLIAQDILLWWILKNFLHKEFEYVHEGKKIKIKAESFLPTVPWSFSNKYLFTRKKFCSLDKNDEYDGKPFEIIKIDERNEVDWPFIVIKFEDGTKRPVFPEEVYEYEVMEYEPVPGECVHGTDPNYCAYCND